MNPDHVVYDVEVVVSCKCGRCFHGSTEQHAIDEWRAHTRDVDLDAALTDVFNKALADWPRSAWSHETEDE